MKNKFHLLHLTAIAVVFNLSIGTANAQLEPGEAASLVQLNTITTAVPFLMIAPDSRSGALGDAGVALSPDGNSLHWNPAKMAFSENELEMSLESQHIYTQMEDGYKSRIAWLEAALIIE